MRAACLAAVAATALPGASASGLGHLLGHGHGHSHAHGEGAAFGGEKMERTFTSYVGLPVGEAELRKAGWTKHNSVCDPHLGFAWTEDRAGATKKKPLLLYTTAGGQPSGVGALFIGYKGKSPLPAAQQQWATANPLAPHSVANGADVAQVDVAFRSGDILCSGAKSDSPVGDTLVVNPMGAGRTLPITEKGVEAEGWRRGSCFDGMGWHWFLDTAVGGGKMSHKAENLFPIVTMFHEGEINAIFFANTNDQISIPIIASNEWEPKALSDGEMCKNTCDQDCTFAGTDSWSTLHIYFRDHKEVTCAADLKCGLTWPFRGNCCDAASDMLV